MAKPPLTPDEIAEIQRMQTAAAAGMHYEILGVDPTASRAEIDAAYRDRVRAWHPDRFYARDQGEFASAIQDNFVEITRAWRLLKEDHQRAAYDRELKASGRMPEPKTTFSSVATQADLSSTFEVKLSRQDGKLKVDALAPVEPVAPPPPKIPTAVDRIRQQIAAQLAKAKEYYDAGKADAAQGAWTKAEASLYLATRYDPKNKVYAEAHKEAAANSKRARAAHHLQLAEQAESYAKQKEAVDHLRRAVECDPAEGTAYARLARLLKDSENDLRGAVEMYRKAVQKEPNNMPWHFALAESLEAVGQRALALREARLVADAEPKNEKAKAMVKRLGG